MSIDGTYGFVYSGSNGIGVGVFTVDHNLLRGVDFAGGRYEGTAKENPDGSISLDIEFEVKPGMTLVQGTAPQDVTHRRRINHIVPALFGNGEPLKIPSPPGAVNIMVKQVPDEWARAVDNGVTLNIGPA